MSKVISRSYNRIPFKKNSLGFHMIPYHLQYETRDFNKVVQKPSVKTLMNREKYIKEFNPYLKSNVSENLDNKLADFYRYKYSKR
tara:strand:- start:274 stop:528 length:255 start_codon:yes stop_codon:yes gene_type:complete